MGNTGAVEPISQYAPQSKLALPVDSSHNSSYHHLAKQGNPQPPPMKNKLKPLKKKNYTDSGTPAEDLTYDSKKQPATEKYGNFGAVSRTQRAAAIASSDTGLLNSAYSNYQQVPLSHILPPGYTNQIILRNH